MKRKISFLMAAHNEEKVISKSLSSLLDLPNIDYEVIVGLDGCTDNTLDIVKSFVKKSSKFRYKELNLRQGKPAVINELIKMAEGEIIVIQDADWIFSFGDKSKLIEFFSVFDNQEIGGIAESFPVEWNEKKIRRANLTYKMVAYSTFFWIEYQKENYTLKKGEGLVATSSNMFLTNIFRKKLYRRNTTLGDDFERTHYIVDQGYKIILFDDEKMPRMTAVYNEIKFKDFFKQKIRTALARRQLKESTDAKTSIKNYYFPAVWFIFVNSWKESFSIGLLMLFWITTTSFATLVAKFKKSDTLKGWTLRAER